MAQIVSIQLSDEALLRYQRGATAARKLLEEFLVERLREAVPPLADDLSSPLKEALKELEELDDEALKRVLQSELPLARQRRYSRLLTKQREDSLTPQEQEKLHALGEEARLLTLKKAHAALLLQWRGHPLPVPAPEAFPNPR